MGWSSVTMRLVDEVALQSADELLGIIGARLKRNAPYAADFRVAALDVFHELWPTDNTVDTHTYLTTVGRDIDTMPGDLLEDLSSALMSHAKSQRASNTPASGATSLIASWLKIRCVELRSQGAMKRHAMRLKVEHIDVLKQALATEADTQAELAL